jgi:predicted metal-dependent peptidase
MTTVTFDKAKADLQLSRAKISVMKDKKLVFFSVLVMNMRYKWDLSIPTAATDGRTIFINPVTYGDLTDKTRVSRLMHEVTHCTMGHCGRRGHRNKMKWNRAVDYYTNLMLVDAGFEKISTWLYDEKYRGMSSEEIYDALPDEPEDDFDPDLLEPGEGESDGKTDQQIQYQMDKLLLQAAMTAQKAGQPGSVPGSIEFYLNKLLHPKLPWNVILKRWFGQYIKKGFNWKTPNRRYDEYLPSRKSPSIANAAFATDISGSVSDEDYQRIVSEVAGVFASMKPKFIHYLMFSESLISVDKVRSVKELKNIKFIGRGGTDVKEVFEWADKNHPKVLVILTDGGFYWPRENGNPFDESSPHLFPKCDVVWLIHDNPDWQALYGKVIHYEVNARN